VLPHNLPKKLTPDIDIPGVHVTRLPPTDRGTDRAGRAAVAGIRSRIIGFPRAAQSTQRRDAAAASYLKCAGCSSVAQ